MWGFGVLGPSLARAGKKSKIPVFAFLESEFQTPKFAKNTSRKSKSRFDQLDLEQNCPKKKTLTSKVARNNKKLYENGSRTFLIFLEKLKKVKKKCASRAVAYISGGDRTFPEEMIPNLTDFRDQPSTDT